ncbi:MAG: acetylxylan esterase [Clostridia bacterium]
MPLVDKPLKELKTYMGISPCPADIDGYWNRALEEMKAVKPEVEVKKASFQWEGIKCYDMHFTGVRNGNIYSRLLVPQKSDKKTPALIRFHGYHGNTQDWSQYLAFALSGFTVAAMDVRGQGGLSSDGASYKGSTIKGHIIRGLDDDPQNLAFRHIFLDAAQLTGIIMSIDEVDERRVGCYGGSQGGGLALACAALEPRISRVVSLHPFLSDYQRVWEMDLVIQAYEEIGYHFRNFDPGHDRENEIFHTLGYIDVKNIVKRISGKVLMGTGLMDTICPPSSVFAAYNNIRSEKQMKVYPDFKHENIPEFADLTYQFFKELLYE